MRPFIAHHEMIRPTTMTSLRVALGILLLASVALPALARDGRIEINQASALAGGVTAGDTADFPVTLSSSGSYVLTGNLSVTDPARDGIEVTTDGVSIDLNGFAIAGPATCTGSGSTLTCSAGSGSGVDATSRSRITIENGRVLGFPGGGVIVGERAEIRDLVVESNGVVGVFTSARSRFHRVTADLNRGNGITTSSTSVVEASVCSRNFNNGIDSGGGAGVAILGCVALSNGGHGLSGGGVVRDSIGSFNGGDGIIVQTGSLVSDCSATQNLGDGIQGGVGTAGAASVQRSVVQGNTGFGLRLTPSSTYRENTINSNVVTNTVTGGVDMGSNSCNGANTCP